MDLNYIRKLIRLVSESGVDEIEIEEEGKKIRIAKHQNNAFRGAQGTPLPVPVDISIPAPGAMTALPSLAAAAASVPPAPPGVAPPKYHEIKSPIVGTFYRSPAPDAAPFVQVGSEIETGTVLCIVEAMKLMNEIEADSGGKIAKIMVENGQPVEYDQTLFLVEPA